MNLQELVSKTFQEKFNEEPSVIVRAPGRVNLIGEHTDYNDGFVLPMAINRAVWIALRPRNDKRVSIEALDFESEIAFSLDNFTKDSSSPAEYVKGIAWALQEAGYPLAGWEGVMKGDVPIGAGLSSSAALELAVARAFAHVSHLSWDAATMARLAQKTENKWVGVNSGIMDQMISASGKANHALLIDCRSLETEALPIPPNSAVIVMDTSTRRELVTSAYNERRQQCEEAAAYFGVEKLRDVSEAEFEAKKEGLAELPMRRARHVITENERVMQAKEAMLRGDAVTLGKLFDASHVSMRDDFEITNDALNAIVAAAQSHPACYGARMTGGGFGGCAVALVKSDGVADFVEATSKRYTEETKLIPAVYVCEATNGAEVINLR
jgi:galactokinase